MSDLIDKDMAIAAIRKALNGMPLTVMTLPPDQPEITDEQAILHLQSTGWMQNHDREMYESGLRRQMDDDRCYECTGDGDDYYYDEDTGEYVHACNECPYAERKTDDYRRSINRDTGTSTCN
ncbi:MAG: hypothetical protein IIZ93_14685 [Acidaminococcaceae bacterium]|nr:hypothetical protein [Acidaminococcaceae bacterium]